MATGSGNIKASDHDSYGTLSLITFLIPLVGLVLGIIYLTKEDKLSRKLGEHLLVVSILATILWGIIWIVFLSSQAVNEIEYINL